MQYVNFVHTRLRPILPRTRSLYLEYVLENHMAGKPDDGGRQKILLVVHLLLCKMLKNRYSLQHISTTTYSRKC